MSKVQFTETGHFNFGDRTNYSAGGGIPDGHYGLWFTFMNHAGQSDRSKKMPMRMGVMVQAVNLTDPTQPAKEHFYSMGTDAIKCFQPDPDFAGKRLKPVPGAPGFSLVNSTNWYMFLDNFYNCGLPDGLLSDDLSVIDGVWVNIQNVPELEQRSTFASSKTSEYQGQDTGPRKVAVPVLIHEGGKPWEGGGGMIEAPLSFNGVNAQAATAPAPLAALPLAAKPLPKPAAKPVAAKPAPAAPAAKPLAPPKPGPARAVAPPPVAPAVAVDVPTAAVDAITAVLGANQNGLKHLKFRVDVVKAAQARYGDEVASAIVDTYFGDLDTLNTVIGEYGYTTNGTEVSLAV